MRKVTKKMRGSHTHGYGGKKKHRGKGSRGGVGRAGKHKGVKLGWGRRGFVRHALRREINTINVGELNKIDKEEINLKEMGIHKLLGAGYINRPVKVIVEKASENAVRKIEEAGGKVIVG
ncbi:MAG: uL15 family ribosomal protein [Thermoplasmatales archaeon]|nr:uL15 family ribosomal protein [Thermoplasmatales archaeon]